MRRTGRFALANLKAGKYVVRAAKEGFDADVNEQAAEIQKGEDKRVTFQFRRKPQNATASIRLTPGSELVVDGNSLGPTQEDTRIVRDLKAGAHTFRAQKGKQFQASQKTLELARGPIRGARLAIDRTYRCRWRSRERLRAAR